MPDCPRYQDDLKAYCDRELSWPARLRLRRHLAVCPLCQEEIAQMTQIAKDLRASEPSDAPLNAALREKILAAAAPVVAADPAHRPRAPRPLEWAAVCLIFLFVAAVFLFPVLSPAREKARNISVASVARQMELQRMQADTAAPAPTTAVMPLETRQVHNQASIGVQVDDPEAKSDEIAQMVKDAGGYVADNTLNANGDGTKTASLTINVPAPQFDDILSRIGKMGDVQSKNVTGEDITDKTSDAQQAEGVLEGEVAQSQARLAKLGKHAGWNDAQSAQELTIQLAQARARLVLLHKLGQLSEIDVTLTQKPAPAPPVQNGFVSGLSGTTRSATGSLLSSATLLLSLFIWVLAYAPLWLPLALIGRFLYRRFGTTKPVV